MLTHLDPRYKKNIQKAARKATCGKALNYLIDMLS